MAEAYIVRLFFEGVDCFLGREHQDDAGGQAVPDDEPGEPLLVRRIGANWCVVTFLQESVQRICHVFKEDRRGRRRL